MTQQTAAITGANSGIGFEITSLLLRNGWRVFGMDIKTDRLQSLLASHPEHLSFGLCDVGDPASVRNGFRQVEAWAEGLDALICSAGVLRTAPLMTMDVAQFDQVLAVNTRGPLLCAQAAHPLLGRKAAEASPARIIMLSSVAAIRPKVGGGAYAASKAALSRLVRVMAVELGPEHIRVNAVAPSSVDTPMIQHVTSSADAAGYKASGNSPLGRISRVAEIATVVHFLLTPAADYINGVTIPVDGGTTAAYVPA